MNTRTIIVPTLRKIVAIARAILKVMVVVNWHGWQGFKDELNGDSGTVLDDREQQIKYLLIKTCGLSVRDPVGPMNTTPGSDASYCRERFRRRVVRYAHETHDLGREP